MMERKMLPIGIDNFEKLRKNDFYYVDKTGLLIDLLNRWSEVTLFTRPRRFGKSLNMSMLKAFFSPESDKSIFDGLKIAGETALCEKYMGQFPVISISLKSVSADCFETAYRMAADLIREAAVYVDIQTQGSRRLHPADREDLNRLLQTDMPESVFCGSLYTLSRILKRHYGQDVVILIDEYDVPLEKAYAQGYYDRMVLLIRNLFDRALKTNDNLKLAVLTGCMRISRESIFTGMNNLRIATVADSRFGSYFGFTDPEVRELLACYGFSDKYEVVRAWYDGYQFGNVHIYCPWDVINYCDLLIDEPDRDPRNYWINSSDNQIIRRFVSCSARADVKRELELLVNGEAVEKTVVQELTYRDMYASTDNLWSVLFMTGYLTQRADLGGDRFRLVIPNREIRSIFISQILAFFREGVQKDGETLSSFYNALETGNAAGLSRCLQVYLQRTVSVRDTAVRSTMKENFYHGMLLGILGVQDRWSIASNREAGDGYSDITVRADDGSMAAVIEVKYADDGNLTAACQAALAQMEEKRYAAELYNEEYRRVLLYGIAFCRKKCAVMLAGDGERYI